MDRRAVSSSVSAGEFATTPYIGSRCLPVSNCAFTHLISCQLDGQRPLSKPHLHNQSKQMRLDVNQSWYPTHSHAHPYTPVPDSARLITAIILLSSVCLHTLVCVWQVEVPDTAVGTSRPSEQGWRPFGTCLRKRIQGTLVQPRGAVGPGGERGARSQCRDFPDVFLFRLFSPSPWRSQFLGVEVRNGYDVRDERRHDHVDIETHALNWTPFFANSHLSLSQLPSRFKNMPSQAAGRGASRGVVP